jgi:maltose alpha-D-glucosyltransferase/alpha-amylase
MRRFLDQHYKGRMFLAEVTQTPALPYNHQWALFLRNYDAMGVKMLTDAERKRLYQAYAPEPRMLLHTEIRRRLAPLLHGHLGRLQLLHSLLLSLPGTPVLYYGDEIGMGDNVFLDDRAGVRTPMQWSGDRNAGFSRADSQRLYAPVITDPVYGYQGVNVESQKRDPASLLRWMQRMMALRKQYKVFGRGEMTLLQPRNRTILAYIRHDATDTMLIVANLSSQPQQVELDLAAYTGMVPREMFREGEFPPIRTGPYELTLGPYVCSWLHL